jgi:N-acetyl-1-D-myo-inositol-2-amino-2-deoxy-alpha-D-glucopyranoside deacetylase
MPPPLLGSSLLAVFAHPDDESLACGGLLALCSEQGARVSVLCLTRGELGPGGSGASIGELRERELRAAARVLGVHRVELGGHEDGMLPWVEPELLEAAVLSAIAQSHADVVVTFDADGLYWHPDHIAVHERVTAAVAGLGESAPALFYASLPAGAMRAVAEATPSASGAPVSILGVEDLDAFGADALAPTLVLDVSGVVGKKLAALRCHRSQVEGSALDRIQEGDAARALGTEHYRRAATGRAGEVFLDRLGSALGSGSL